MIPVLAFPGRRGYESFVCGQGPQVFGSDTPGILVFGGERLIAINGRRYRQPKQKAVEGWCGIFFKAFGSEVKIYLL